MSHCILISTEWMQSGEGIDTPGSAGVPPTDIGDTAFHIIIISNNEESLKYKKYT